MPLLAQVLTDAPWQRLWPPYSEASDERLSGSGCSSLEKLPAGEQRSRWTRISHPHPAHSELSLALKNSQKGFTKGFSPD